jgi:hypothetical protein
VDCSCVLMRCLVLASLLFILVHRFVLLGFKLVGAGFRLRNGAASEVARELPSLDLRILSQHTRLGEVFARAESTNVQRNDVHFRDAAVGFPTCIRTSFSIVV